MLSLRAVIGSSGGLGGRALVPNNDCGGRRRLGLKMPWLAVDKLFTFFILLSALHLSRSLRSIPRSGPINYREEEKKILDSILGPEVYDKRIRPSGLNGTDAATIIVVNLYIRSFAKIDDVKMEYSVQITFRQKWNDERLSYDHRLSHGDMRSKIKYLTMTDARKVWMPDTFFRNEKEGRFHNILVPNVYIRIFPNGDVLYSIRVSLTLACPMNLKLYPLDRQQCSLRVASYGWTTGDLQYIWKTLEPVQIVKDLHLPRFTLEKYISDYCNIKTNTGEYSCLTVDLTFKREFSYYLLTIYVPCCMLVIVSWVSFWLDPNAVPARVSLGVTTLLTMSTQTASINNSLPPVAYTKAIDVWTGVCVTFVFSALLEYALVNYASRSDAQRLAKKKHQKQWELDHCAFDPEHMEDLPPGSGPPPGMGGPPANNGGGSFAMVR
ncbi:glutamate-gated chloride channel-like [Tigriopus californicus]|uniref:glutamate-gated chloride channel-like n=1 Tax=Tigriopus californicus TaxID=6832 RepID=UPI0027DA2969|nr:glutamate-gated chloride channel-like [Tigriopus californicus]